MAIQLNQDQLNLIETLKEFWKNPSKKNFLLSGQAGVGKTTCVRYFLDYVGTDCVCLTAPTNKATKVLRKTTNKSQYTYKTIYSLLGLSLQANGSVKELTDLGFDNAGHYDLVVIDEASMLKQEVLDYLHKKTALTGTKILMIGDREQLPPVGDTESPIWSKYSVGYELTKVERHQNAILTFVQSIRANSNPKFVSPGNEVEVFSDENPFMERLFADVDAGLFHAGTSKAIAWRNDTVAALNKMIRERAIGEEKSRNPFIKGDRILFTAPVTKKTGKAVIPLASVDDEGVVNSYEKTEHPVYSDFRILSVTVKLDDSSETIRVNLIDPRDSEKLDRHLKQLAEKKMWGQFWAIKDSFHSVSYAYALTAHRAQGSTFENVYLEAGDIMANRYDVETRTKCLYVAASRASEKLFIFS
jgi:ATP-dependent exoDNAse (exonuclease V) alpha subunit